MASFPLTDAEFEYEFELQPPPTVGIQFNILWSRYDKRQINLLNDIRSEYCEVECVDKSHSNSISQGATKYELL